MSALFGVKATWNYEKGSIYTGMIGPGQKGQRVQGFSIWGLDSASLIKSRSVEEHALALLEKLESARESIRPYLESKQHDIRIRIWWEAAAPHTSFDCSAETMLRLSSWSPQITVTHIAQPFGWNEQVRTYWGYEGDFDHRVVSKI